MDQKALLSALSDIPNKYGGALIRTRGQYSDLPPAMVEALALHSVGAHLGEILEQQPELSGWMIREGNGAASLNMMLQEQLPRRALRESPARAIEWLEKIRRFDQASVYQIIPLWGAEIAEPVDLLENVRLVPFSALPDSPQRQRWSHFLRQPVKVDFPMKRTIHNEDAETIFS
jgi:hypothetical protein